MEQRVIKFRSYSSNHGIKVWGPQPNLILWITIFDDNPMQFIGISDKNKTDVYEHDIVAYHTGHRRGTSETPTVYTGVIVWKGYSWCLMSRTDDDGKLVYFNLTGNYWFGSFKPENFEVIGNIHENPDWFTPEWNAAVDRYNTARQHRLEFLELSKESESIGETDPDRLKAIRARQTELRKLWDL